MEKSSLYTAKQRFEQSANVIINDVVPSEIMEKYDDVFRFVDISSQVFVCVQGGKKGLVDEYGKEIIPCEQDEIFEMMDTDGVIPFTKDGKWGLCYLGVCTAPIYEDIEICSEEYCRVLINGQWGWIDSEGKFTMNESEAWFGSWCDCEK